MKPIAFGSGARVNGTLWKDDYLHLENVPAVAERGHGESALRIRHQGLLRLAGDQGCSMDVEQNACDLTRQKCSRWLGQSFGFAHQGGRILTNALLPSIACIGKEQRS